LNSHNSEDVQILIGIPKHGGDLVLQIRIADQVTEITMSPRGAQVLAASLLEKVGEYERLFPEGTPLTN
jgi:hypothetical protein